MGMNLIKKIQSLPFLSGKRRLNFTLICGAIVNLAYIAGNVASAVMYRSLLSATLTVYHLTLIIIRLYIFYAARSSISPSGIGRVILRVGVLLLFLDLASAFIILYTVSLGVFVKYSGVIFLGFLIYSAFSVTTSLLAMRKHESENNYLHYAAGNITLSTALMSVFNLQYSLLSYLGADSTFSTRASFTVGIGVFSMILTLALRLIRKSR